MTDRRRSPSARRELLIVMVFTLAIFAPFLGKAVHNDEPVFIAIGDHILREPMRPLALDYFWFGKTQPMTLINTTPNGFHYLMAFMRLASGSGQGAAVPGGASLPPLAGGRGEEVSMRLVFLPFCLLASWALYAIASRFLARPLLPVLIVVACPAFLLNMGHLMPEAPSVALAWAGLAFLLVGVDDRRPSAWWLSAVLIGVSGLFKYNGVLLLVPAAAYAWLRGVPVRRVAAFAAVAAAPVCLALAQDLLSGGAFAARALEVTTESTTGWWSSVSHKARSFLAFTGGCAIVTALWPLAALRGARPGWKHGLAAAGVILLFLPWFDLVQVRLVDRLTGIVLSFGAVLGLAAVLSARPRVPGWQLWLPWLACTAAIQIFLYWSVMARIVLHMIPPMVFALAAGFEASLDESRWRRLALASLALVTVSSLLLGVVDYSYAEGQKTFSRRIEKDYLSRGRTVYFTGAMGLQYYLERAGAKGLELTRGGWDLVQPGESVVMLRINTVPVRPVQGRLADVHRQVQGHPIPLRLMSGWEGEGGFYSNLSGFLPFSLSTESLEEFSVVEIR